MKRYWTYTLHYRILAFFSCIFILGSISAFAQRTCGTPEAIRDALKRNPELSSKLRALQMMNDKSLLRDSSYKSDTVVNIPVVVHIVLQDPDQVSDAQVQSQIAVLNKDYNFLNADTINIPKVWKPDAGNMRINFCLARRTPNGVPTSGIERVKTNTSQFGILDAAKAVKHNSSGGSDSWNSKDYLNIWVCKLSQNTLGIGTPPGLYPEDEEGVVIHYKAFGTVGNLFPNFDEGRSCTHELGHYFNLYHLWGDGTGGHCFPGDYIDDTPPQSAAVYGTPLFPYLKDTCSPNVPGIMINNFMGYTDDAAMNMFTNDQTKAASNALFNLRSSLLLSNGCQPVGIKDNDAWLRSLSVPKGELCNNSVSPVVMLENYGKDTLHAVNINYRIDGGDSHVYRWTGKLTTFDSVEVMMPDSMFTTISTGSHQMEIYTTLPNGLPDERTSNDTLTTSFHLNPIETATIGHPFREGFEGNTFPPTGWTIKNPDNNYTWQKTSQAADSGTYSVVVKNFLYNANGPKDDLISPAFNLQKTDTATFFLVFDVAAAVYSDPNGNNRSWDTLEVLISYDCGETGTIIYKKWGKDLITTAKDKQEKSEFIPTAEQWRSDSVNLTSYLNNGSFRLIFRNITNHENNIYLDNIQIKGINPILVERKVIVVPNPVSDQLQVQFLNPQVDGLQAVSIYNILGQVIARKSASSMDSNNVIRFNLKNNPDGVYFVKIYFTDHRNIVKKIIKVR